MKNNLEQRFKELEGQFDTEEPKLGHFDRFRVKQIKNTSKPKWNPNTWKWLAVAASIILILGIWLGSPKDSEGLELADVSPKMEETQSFFTATIQNEIEQIAGKRNPENKQVIDDGLEQLKKLESEYIKLTIALDESNKDRRIIYAMITNFQQRITVLQSLLDKLDEIELLKNNTDEKII